MPYTTRKRSLRSNNCLTKTSSKKLKKFDKNYDNQPLDTTSSDVSITASVINDNDFSTSNNVDYGLDGINQLNSDAEAFNKSTVRVVKNTSNVNAKANEESLILSAENNTPRASSVISLGPSSQLNSSTNKEQWRNQVLQTDPSLNRHSSNTPMPNRSIGKNDMSSTKNSTQVFNPSYNGKKALPNIFHTSSSNSSTTGRKECFQDKSPLNGSSTNIPTDNNINTNSSISVSRRPTARTILRNNTSTNVTNSTCGSTLHNRSSTAMPVSTRAVIEGSLEYRELKRDYNAEKKKNEEWKKDYGLLKKEFEEIKSSYIPRPAASVVGWLEEVLYSIDESQYQGDGRSKGEVANKLGLDPISLLTVAGRTAQKTALKIFRRKYPTPRARAEIGSIVEMDDEELNNIYVYSRWLHRKFNYSIDSMRKAIAASIRNAVNTVRKLAEEQQMQLNAIADATDLDEQERDKQVQSALNKLQEALDKSIIDDDEEFEEELDFMED